MKNLLFNFNTQNIPKYFEYSNTEAFFIVHNFNLLFKYSADFIIHREMNLTKMSPPFSSHIKRGINKTQKGKS